MLSSLLTLLILALVLVVIYLVMEKFIQGPPLMIIGLIFAIILLIYALKLFGLVTL